MPRIMLSLGVGFLDASHAEFLAGSDRGADAIWSLANTSFVGPMIEAVLHAIEPGDRDF